MWKTEEFMFGAIIWLAALTLIVIVFIIILIILSCIQCNRRRQLYSQINTTNVRILLLLPRDAMLARY